MQTKIEELRKEHAELKNKIESDASIYSSSEYPKLAKRQKQIDDILQVADELDRLRTQAKDSESMFELGGELGELAAQEIEELRVKILAAEQALDLAVNPKDPNNDRDCIIEIRPGAGGDESSLFAVELYKMYYRYAEIHGFKIELINEIASEVGGFKEIIFAVRGDHAYGKLRLEAGVHRVQRVPATESQGRIHTSTVTVAVLPEAEEADIEIKPQDLRIDVYHASGHGGQSVNTTDSAVRITHLPTGLVVTCQDEKSQTKNKLKAMGVLRSRLLQQKIDDEQQKLSDARKKLIGSGDRSEKIRTYNFPQDRITDHRIGYSRSNIPGAMAGEIDDLIEELEKADHDLLVTEE